jgi:hypothetical protein
MIDDEKESVISTRVEEREWLTVETVAGDVFEIARPLIPEKVEAEPMNKVRAIIAIEGNDRPSSVCNSSSTRSKSFRCSSPTDNSGRAIAMSDPLAHPRRKEQHLEKTTARAPTGRLNRSHNSPRRRKLAVSLLTRFYGRL